jgi:hypothetical protein
MEQQVVDGRGKSEKERGDRRICHCDESRDGGRQRSTLLLAGALVVEPEERGIQSPPVDDFQDGFAHQQQSQRAVFARSQYARINGQQKKADGEHDDVSGSVGEELPRNAPNVVEHRP